MKRSLFAFLSGVLLAGPAVAAVPFPESVVPPMSVATPVTHALSNGMRVVVIPDSRLPVVHMQLRVPAGVFSESDSMAGIAALTAGMITQGTSSRTAAQFAAEREAIGATIAANVGRDFAQVACGARSASFDAALELLSDAVINPIFDETEFNKLRRATALQLGGQNRSLAYVVDERTWEAVFGSHPYAHSLAGNVRGLLGASRDAVRGFHRDFWRPNQAVLVITGDVPAEHAFAVAEEWFGRWSGRTEPRAAIALPAPRAGVRVVDLEEAAWSEVRLAYVGPGRASPDIAGWQVAASALDDGRLPYRARAAFTVQRDASLLVISASAPLDSLAAVTAALRSAVQAFAKAPPAGATLEALQRRVAGSQLLQFDGIVPWLNSWQALDYAGLQGSSPAAQAERLAAPGLSLASVCRVLSQPGLVVVAGPGEAFSRRFARFGAVDVVPLQPQVLAAADTLPAPDAEQHRRGRQVVQAALAAHGGAAKIQAVASSVVEGDFTIFASGQGVPGQFSMVRVDPSRFSFATKLLQFENRQVLDGDTGWSLSKADTATFTELDSVAVQQLRITFESDVVHMLRWASAANGDAARRGTETIAGRACDLVDFRGPGGARYRMAVDAVTHRVVHLESGLGPDREWHDRRVYSRYEDVKGVLVPGVEEHYLDGELVMRFSRHAGTHNAVIPASLFTRPRVVHGQILANP